MRTIGRLMQEMNVFFNRENIILRQAKKENNIVYGSQALKKQIGFLARPPNDYDLYAKHPKRSANRLESTLDRKSGGDLYYVKPSKHHGTYKVKYKGDDDRKNTADDIKIADYSTQNRPLRTVVIDGVRYVHLSEIEKDKKRTLKEGKALRRLDKDREDLERIKISRWLR